MLRFSRKSSHSRKIQSEKSPIVFLNSPGRWRDSAVKATPEKFSQKNRTPEGSNPTTNYASRWPIPHPRPPGPGLQLAAGGSSGVWREASDSDIVGRESSLLKALLWLRFYLHDVEMGIGQPLFSRWSMIPPFSKAAPHHQLSAMGAHSSSSPFKSWFEASLG